MEDRTVPSTFTQVANPSGYATDANQDGIFDFVAPGGPYVQASVTGPSSPTYDQVNTQTPIYAYNTSASSNLSIGQEFKPTASSMNFVDLLIADAGSDTGPGASFQVKIHSGTINGTVLATSNTSFVSDNTNLGGGTTYTRFTFSSPVALTPGSTYVMELVQLGPIVAGNSNFELIGDYPTGTDYYSSGRAILGGTPVTNHFDFNFDEGLIASSGSTQVGVMEFSTAGLSPSSAINSVTLSGTVDYLQTTPSAMNVGFYGYAGTGTITTADATASNTLYGSLTNPGLGQFSVSLSPSLVQSLISSPQYNGYLSILVSGLSTGQSFYINDTSSLGGGTLPTLQINYTSTGQPPTADNDSYSLTENQPLTVAAPGVLANDTDSSGNPLTASLVAGPSHGTLTLNSNGSFTYTPSQGYSGADQFSYEASDGVSTSNTAVVSLSVAPPLAPVANNDSYSVNENQTLTVSPVPGTTSLTMQSQTGDYIGQGHNYSYTSANGTFTANRNYDNGVSLSFQSSTDWWNLDFAAPGNVTLTPGSYLNAMRFPFQNSNTPGLDVAGDGRGSNTLTGSFNILQAVYDNSGNVERFDATFVQHSEGATPALTGEIKYNVSTAASGVLSNDTDPNGTTLSTILVTGPSHGTLNLNADGTFTYKPNTSFSGVDTFSYMASDGVSNSNVATVTINVIPTPPPIANNDTYTTNENKALTVGASGVLSNDSDPSGGPLSAIVVTGPSHGTLSLNANGSFTYNPSLNFFGVDTFTYKANDGANNSNIATVTVNVNFVYQPPVATNDSYVLNENTTLTVGTPGVLSNDTDAENQPLTAALVSGTTHGSLTFNADGSFIYTPTVNYDGVDSFTYQTNDGEASSNIATISLTVNHVNQAPVAYDDTYSVNSNQTLTIAPVPTTTSLTMQSQPGDYIGQGQNYSYSAGSGTFTATHNFDNGVSVSFNQSGSVWWYLDFAAPGDPTLTPGTYVNATRFGFQSINAPGLDVSGEGRGSNTLTGQFTVLQATYDNAGHVGSFDATFEQHSEGATPALTGEIKYNYAPTLSGVLANDTDADNNVLTAVLVTGPSHGSMTLNSDGTFSYTPNANFSGVDTFTYKANDGLLDSNIATVSINVLYQPPVAVNSSYTTNSNTPLIVSAASGVLAGDSDPENEALTAQLVTGPTHGTLALNSDGSFTYIPTTAYFGPDSFTYQAADAQGVSNTATVSLTVAYQPPVAVNAAYSTNANTPLIVSATSGVLAGDFDPENEALTAQLVTGPTHGTLTLNGDGSFTYTPTTAYFGSDGFTYQAADANGVSNTAAVSLTVAYQPPVALNAAYSTNANTTLSVAASAGVLVGDTDPENEVLSAQLVNGPSHGALALHADGSFTYTPTTAYFGPDSFTYQAADAHGVSNTATVSLTVAYQPPVAVNAAYSTNANTPLIASTASGVLAGDSDPENEALTAQLMTGPTHGTLTLNGDGSFTYTPTTAYFGSDSFTYQAADAQGVSNIATVSLTVAYQPPVAVNAAYSTNANTPLIVSAASGVLTGDSDPENEALTAQLVSGPTHGNLALNSNGSFTYTPTTAYFGPDSFTYQAADANGVSNVATVTLNVVQPVTHFGITTQSASVAGGAFNATITALDANNAVVTNYLGTVQLQSNDPRANITPTSYTFTTSDNGQHTFSITYYLAGNQTLSVMDSALQTLTGKATTTVSAAAATSLVVSGFPSPTTAGVSQLFTVTAVDAYGNQAPSYRGKIHFTSSDSKAALPSNYTFTTTDAGVHTFMATLKTAGVQSITTTDTRTGSITGVESNITVGAAGAVKFSVTSTKTSATRGSSFTFVVTALDAFGNVATNYAGDVRFSSTDSTAVLPANYVFQPSDGGIRTFQITFNQRGRWSVSAIDTDNSTIQGSESSISVAALYPVDDVTEGSDIISDVPSETEIVLSSIVDTVFSDLAEPTAAPAMLVARTEWIDALAEKSTKVLTPEDVDKDPTTASAWALALASIGFIVRQPKPQRSSKLPSCNWRKSDEWL